MGDIEPAPEPMCGNKNHRQAPGAGPTAHSWYSRRAPQMVRTRARNSRMSWQTARRRLEILNTPPHRANHGSVESILLSFPSDCTCLQVRFVGTEGASALANKGHQPREDAVRAISLALLGQFLKRRPMPPMLLCAVLLEADKAATSMILHIGVDSAVCKSAFRISVAH